MNHSPAQLENEPAQPAEAQFGALVADALAAGVGAAPTARLGIVGAGMMGVAIAAEAIERGLSVTLVDNNGTARAAAFARIAGELVVAGSDWLPGRTPARAWPLDQAMNLVAERVRVIGDLAALSACDLIVESVPETLAAKHDTYRALEPHLAPDCVLASNTSTIPIRELARGVARAERFCGMHFFHPVRRRPLVEVIAGTATDTTASARVRQAAMQLGKLPIAVPDGPGFLVNRLLMPYLNEAMALACEGMPLEAIDAAALAFGMGMGPLALLDEIGLETALRGGLVLYQAFGDRLAASPLVVSLIKAKRRGASFGAGFYRYRDGRREVDPAIEPILASWSRAPRNELPPIERMLLAMLVEAARVIDEGQVGPAEIDLAVVLGLGFPRRRGGLLRWADGLGQELARHLSAAAALGPHFDPPASWRDGARFYA